MTPLAIPVWRYHITSDRFLNRLTHAVAYFTGTPYVHAGLLFEGRLYECGVWRECGRLLCGVRTMEESEMMVKHRPDVYVVPWRLELTLERMECIRERIPVQMVAIPYGLIRRVVLFLVWHTRWLWKRIGRVPMADSLYGRSCARFVDEIMLESRWDLFPEMWEGYRIPGDFLQVPGWIPKGV